MCGRRCDLSRAASRFVHDSTAREPIKREELQSRPFSTADKHRDANRAQRRSILHDVRNAAADVTQRRLRRLHGAGCATQRGDDKLLGIIAVMCVGALTTQFRRCFIYHGISRCINIYPLAIYTGR